MTPDDFSEVHRNFNKAAKSNANTLIFAKSPLGSVKNGVKNGVKFENGDTIIEEDGIATGGGGRAPVQGQ